VGDVWVGTVWACILIFVWLRGKIRVGEWCCEVVESCAVEEVVRCGFLLPRNPMKTCMCVCVDCCLRSTAWTVLIVALLAVVVVYSPVVSQQLLLHFFCSLHSLLRLSAHRLVALRGAS